METTTSDANITTDSSSAVDTGAQTANTTDAKTQQSSAESKEIPIKDKSYRDVAHEFMDKYKTKDASKVDEAANPENSPVQKTNPTPEELAAEKVAKDKAATDQTAADAKATKEAKPTDDSKLPFHDHPRFKQLVTERNDFEKKVQEQAPLVDAGKRMQTVETFCRTNNIPVQDYDDAIKLLAEMRTSPETAANKLEQYVQALRIQTGKALPPDLQTRVDEGKLSLTDAQEITKGRVKEQQLTHQVKQSQESAAQQLQRQLVQSIDSWIQSKMKTDPSFKPSPNGDFGKFEQVQDRIEVLAKKENPKSIDDLIALADKAYQQIHRFIEKSIPKPAQQRRLSPSKNSGREQEEVIDTSKPGWAKKVAMRRLASAV